MATPTSPIIGAREPIDAPYPVVPIPPLTPHERRLLIDAPFPPISTESRTIPGKSWAGVYIRFEPLGMRHDTWIMLEDEVRLRQLLTEEAPDVDT